jgi:CubicO group peptidase (beta-lactamase class C family)
MTATIERDATGNALMFTGTRASCTDLARFGYLALHDGRWQDRQVVPEGWFPDATAASQALNTAYGYLWWHNSNGRWLARDGEVVDDGRYSWPDAPADTFSAEGLASQLVIVVPSEDLVVVRLGPPESPNQPEVVGNKILQLLLPD